MQTLFRNKYVLDFVTTIIFFTRIPINWFNFSDKTPDLTKAAWAFPLAGFLIGFLSGVVGDFFIFLGLPVFLCCIISITLSVLLTGAFHEDGLADSADGLGAGGTPKKIDEIIHDSRLGTYGVSALVLGLLLRLSLTLSFVDLGYSLFSILSIGFASGKLAIIYTRKFLNKSKFAKLGSIVGEISNKSLFYATLIWILVALIIFPFYGILFGTIFMAIVIYILGQMSKKALGGITGDILGAVAFLTELAFLFGNLILIFIIN